MMTTDYFAKGDSDICHFCDWIISLNSHPQPSFTKWPPVVCPRPLHQLVQIRSPSSSFLFYRNGAGGGVLPSKTPPQLGLGEWNREKPWRMFECGVSDKTQHSPKKQDKNQPTNDHRVQCKFIFWLLEMKFLQNFLVVKFVWKADLQRTTRWQGAPTQRVVPPNSPAPCEEGGSLHTPDPPLWFGDWCLVSECFLLAPDRLAVPVSPEELTCICVLGGVSLIALLQPLRFPECSSEFHSERQLQSWGKPGLAPSALLSPARTLVSHPTFLSPPSAACTQVLWIEMGILTCTSSCSPDLAPHGRRKGNQTFGEHIQLSAGSNCSEVLSSILWIQPGVFKS